MSDQDSNEDFCMVEDMVLNAAETKLAKKIEIPADGSVDSKLRLSDAENVQLCDKQGNILVTLNINRLQQEELLKSINEADLAALLDFKNDFDDSPSPFSLYALKLINKRIKIKLANKKKKHKYTVRKRWAAQLLKCPPEWSNS